MVNRRRKGHIGFNKNLFTLQSERTGTKAVRHTGVFATNGSHLFLGVRTRIISGSENPAGNWCGGKRTRWNSETIWKRLSISAVFTQSRVQLAIVPESKNGRNSPSGLGRTIDNTDKKFHVVFHFANYNTSIRVSWIMGPADCGDTKWYKHWGSNYLSFVLRELGFYTVALSNLSNKTSQWSSFYNIRE